MMSRTAALGSNGAGDGALNNWVMAMAVNGVNLLVGDFFMDVNNNGAIVTGQ